MTPVWCERPARKPRQNDGLLRADVFEHAQDLDLEFLDFAARNTVLPMACWPARMSRSG